MIYITFLSVSVYIYKVKGFCNLLQNHEESFYL